jgi:predicted DNA-binding transcriptional regulator YafY
MRASRFVSILLMLQTRERMTAQELADTLYGEPGHDGGYRLLGGFRTRLNGLTDEEAETLFLTGLPSAAADLGLGAIVAAAQLN